MAEDNNPDAYNPLDIAQKFVDIASSQGKKLTPMQVLKLTYIAHGWMLAVYKKPLIKERIEAWRYGPVIPSLYRAIKHYRDAPVEVIITNRSNTIRQEDEEFISRVYEGYKEYDGMTLSAITHEEGSAWYEAKNKGQNYLSDEDTQKYYKKILDQNIVANAQQ